MVSVEFGTCSICGKKSIVGRKYYYYDIVCTCCISSEKKHFEIVWYCPDCTPVPPKKISACMEPIQKQKRGIMKIVAVDNYDRESVSDELICENVNEYHGKRIVNLLNLDAGEHSDWFFELKEDDYKLYDASKIYQE